MWTVDSSYKSSVCYKLGVKLAHSQIATALCKGPDGSWSYLEIHLNCYTWTAWSRPIKNKTMQMNRGKLTGVQDIRVCRLKACCLCLRVLSLAPRVWRLFGLVLHIRIHLHSAKRRAETQSSLFLYWLCLSCVQLLGARESFVVVRTEGIPGTQDPEEAFEC